jgi:nitroreductase
VSVSDAIRDRRTHKAYGPQAVDRETLDALLDLARFAPNHHLTNPWRFRVVGPAALARLKEAAGPEQAGKLDRAPTLVAVTAVRTPDDLVADEEDLLATGCAAYIVLLAAHERGLAGYWRTPGVLRTAEGRAALGIGDDERFVALLYLGTARQEPPVPQRAAVGDVTVYLD